MSAIAQVKAPAKDPPRYGTVRAGAPYVAAAALSAIPLWRWQPIAGLTALVLAGGCAAFFRDPIRSLEAEPELLYAAADGRVIGIDQVDDPWYLGVRSVRISIFLSMFDVHVNRSPSDGRIVATRDLNGGFAPAMRFDRSHHNRRREIGLQTERGRILIVQVAGVLARRIVAWAHEGDVLRAGQKLGMITFGSRTDLLVPVELATPLVAVGDRVRAARTPMARWR